MNDPKVFWNKISKNYDKHVNTKYADTYNETIKISKKYLTKEDVVLDYACGTGITTIELSKNVKKINAIDISENMISIAKIKSEKNNISNIEFEITDIFDDKFKKGSFDVIMAFNVLYFIKDTKKVICRINELLKPGGIFILATDCLGEKRTFISIIYSLLSKIRSRSLPFMKSFKISKLKSIITAGDFSIIETHNLYDSPPNYFIVARKNEK